MMEKIYSKVIPTKLLHMVFRAEDFVPGRTEIVDPDNYIQCAALRLDKGTTFKPHKHILKPGNEWVLAQESWVLIQGSVRCTFYDVDNKILCESFLYPGDASFTLEGGHTYTILEDDSIIYEMKTGPYTGQLNDKTFI